MGFCFAIRDGTLEALWPLDSEFYAVVEPSDSQANERRMRSHPEFRGFWVPEDTPAELIPIVSLREIVLEAKAKYGEKAFVFSPDGRTPGSSMLISEELVGLSEDIRIVPPAKTFVTGRSIIRRFS